MGVGTFEGACILSKITDTTSFLFANNPLIKLTDTITISNTIEITGLSYITATRISVYPRNGSFYAEFNSTNAKDYDGKLIRFEYTVTRNN